LQKEHNRTTAVPSSKPPSDIMIIESEKKEMKKIVIKKEIFNDFGSEVSNDFLTKPQMKILRKIGLSKVLKVSKRKKGMTSSGIGGSCHSNVNKLVKRYGGKQLLGYGLMNNVGYNGKRCLQFFWHSVWMTPEGKLIDPTISMNDNNFTYFAPVVFYSNDTEWTHGMDLMFPEDFETNGYIMQGDSEHPDDEVRPFIILDWETTIGSMDLGYIPESINDPKSGFTKPSMITGKTYDETLKSIN
jgi:hypothetical protein